MKKTSDKPLIILITCLLSIMRFLYYGFRYFPHLNDYVQLHNLTASGEGRWATINRLGLFAARPLAGFFDIFVWSHFWDCLIIVVIIMAILHAMTGIILWNLFRKYFNLSYLFLIIFVLFPTGFEGTYWLSAATRILPGMFLAALSARMLDDFLRRRRAGRVAGAGSKLFLIWLTSLLSFGFYEPVLVFSVTLFAIVIWLNKQRVARGWVFFFIPLINGIIYFMITKTAGPSAYYDASGSNAVSALLHGEFRDIIYYIKNILPNFFTQLGKVFVAAPFMVTFRGLWRGILQINADGAWVYIVIIAVLAIIAARLGKKVKVAGGGLGKLILTSLILLILPLAPIMILFNPVLSLQTSAVTFFALALLIDGTIYKIFRGNITYKVLCFSCVLILLISAASELGDYRLTYYQDKDYTSQIAAALENVPQKGTVLIYGAQPSYLDDQNYYYLNHIHGVTESGWATGSAYEATTGDLNKHFVLLSMGDAITKQDADALCAAFISTTWDLDFEKADILKEEGKVILKKDDFIVNVAVE